MKLNPDCIRAVLLEVEKNWELQLDSSGNIRKEAMNLAMLYNALPNYDKRDVFYTVSNLQQAGFLDAKIQYAANGTVYYCAINHVTYAGHQFLDRIRDTKNWSKIKAGLDHVRNYSLDAITALAEGVANAAIAAFLKEQGL